MLLFSIAFHEEPCVTIDTIRNIFYCNPNSYIVCHATQDIRIYLEKLNVNNLIINPYSYETGYCDGTLGYIHYKNIAYALELNLDFDYFIFSASNELYVKKGLEEFISNYDVGFAYTENDAKNNSYFFNLAYQDSKLKKISKDKKLYSINPEGFFFNREISIEVKSRLEQYFDAFDDVIYGSNWGKLLRTAYWGA